MTRVDIVQTIDDDNTKRMDGGQLGLANKSLKPTYSRSLLIPNIKKSVQMARICNQIYRMGTV